MNTSMENTKSDWTELSGKVKTQFGKLSSEAIESLKGNLDGLSSKIQTAYGYAKDKADKEVSTFKASLHGADQDRKPAAVLESRSGDEAKKTSSSPEATKVA